MKKIVVYLLIVCAISCKGERPTEATAPTKKEQKSAKEIQKQVLLSNEKERLDTEIQAVLEKIGTSIEELQFKVDVGDSYLSFKSTDVEHLFQLYAQQIALLGNNILQEAELNFLFPELNNGHAMLIYNGKDQFSGENLSIGIGLDFEQTDNLKIGIQIASISTTSKVSCLGCNTGCNPRRNARGRGYCSSCSPDSRKKCIKMETIN